MNEYSDDYPKESGILWHYYRDEPHNTLIDSKSIKSKIKITGNTTAYGNTRNIENCVIKIFK